MDTLSSIFQIIAHITLIYNMIIYYRWPSRASTRSPTTSPTISSRSRPSCQRPETATDVQEERKMFQKAFWRYLIMTCVTADTSSKWQSNKFKTTSTIQKPSPHCHKKPDSPEYKENKKNREKLDKTMFDENIQFLLLTCCTTYCWKNRAPGATISSLVKFKGSI